MWEVIDERKNGSEGLYVKSDRLKVPNGWIVRTITARYHAGTHSEQTFVEDRDHEWKLEKPSQPK